MEKIEGTPKTIRELFTGVKYTIHYYQREYQWQTKQIEALIDNKRQELYEELAKKIWGINKLDEQLN
jgi:hypothetical protein